MNLLILLVLSINMLKSQLFEEIKSNLIKYPPIKPRKHMNMEDIIDLLIIYNFDNYNKFLMDFQFGINNPNEEISDKLINKFKNSIEDYFLKYSSNDNDLKEFTKYISLYLTFILKKPLHPIAKINNNYEVKQENNNYYCTEQKKNINTPGSLCKFCVCKSLVI